MIKFSYDENDITDHGMEYIWDDFKDEFLITLDKLQTTCPGYIVNGQNMNWQHKSFAYIYDADLSPNRLLNDICKYNPCSIEVSVDFKKGRAIIIFAHHDGTSTLHIVRPSRTSLRKVKKLTDTTGISGGDISEFDNLNELLRYYGHSV